MLLNDNVLLRVWLRSISSVRNVYQHCLVRFCNGKTIVTYKQRLFFLDMITYINKIIL